MNKKGVLIVGKFPNQEREAAYNDVKLHKPKGSGYGDSFIMWGWVCVVLIWNPLRWIISFDCVIQFIKMVYYWNSANITHAVQGTLIFLLHFAVLATLTYFVSVYKPKGI